MRVTVLAEYEQAESSNSKGQKGFRSYKVRYGSTKVIYEVFRIIDFRMGWVTY